MQNDRGGPGFAQNKSGKRSSHERYDQDGRSAFYNMNKHNPKLKNINKFEVSISNSTYKEYNNYLRNKERQHLKAQTIKMRDLIDFQLKQIDNL